AMLSRDIFVYVGYGRTIVVHHANPYFVAPSRFPQDPLTSYDDWKDATAAYGPVWLTICSLWTLVLGNSPLGYVLAFRLFALAARSEERRVGKGCRDRTVTGVQTCALPICTIVVHHANPYFVAPSRFPQDPLTSYDDWKDATAAYGPVWLTICSLWTLVLGNSPLGYVLAFRLFALAAHLLNIWLVATILGKTGSSARTVTLGTLLYAWNPLVLQESSLGGHNDI